MEEKEILIVKSKLRAYVKDQGLSLAGAVADELSNQIYAVVDGAIAEAKRQNNKTLLLKHLS